MSTTQTLKIRKPSFELDPLRSKGEETYSFYYGGFYFKYTVTEQRFSATYGRSHARAYGSKLLKSQKEAEEYLYTGLCKCVQLNLATLVDLVVVYEENNK